MSSIERTASTSVEPDLICIEIDRWQSLRSETGRLQNSCEHAVHDAGPGVGHENLRRASHSVPQPRLLGTGLHLRLSNVRRAAGLLGRNMFDHQGSRARIAWKFLVRLALHSYVRFSWVLEYILK
jgi:hypothetical protein